MAFAPVFATLVVIFVTLPLVARATTHIVGDYYGWTLNFDYTIWAKGRDFRVGDKLVFKYPVGNHNVFKVGGSDFNTCKVPPASQALATGHDVINLETPGRKWYICGKAHGKHCQMGQKLFIIVQPTTWTPPPHLARRPMQHIVGDTYGWTLNFNYADWAKNRIFRVGDTLVFRYQRGSHNVFKVSGPEFSSCKVPLANKALTTGYDVITLATPGRKWYICGKAHGKHCQMGQKLFISVFP